MRSLYVRIAKKDRKFIKGGRMMANNLESFFTESGGHYHSSQQADEEDESSSVAEHELDIYLMSHGQLALNHDGTKSGRYGGGGGSRKRLRFANATTNGVTARHCVCEKLRKTSRRINTKYLLFANVLRTKALGEGEQIGPGGELKRRFKMRREQPFRHSPNRYVRGF